MKIFKDSLGISSLEDRVKILEDKVEKYETALSVIANAITLNSRNVIELSKYIKRIVDAAGVGMHVKDDDNVFH